MAGSAHAYVRGNTLKFYEWLAASDSSKVPQGPPISICGDCHVGNLGPLADTDGQIDIEIRDLDQTVIGTRRTTQSALNCRWRRRRGARTCRA
jgi:uncharacterized protein (DUF2252 family)